MRKTLRLPEHLHVKDDIINIRLTMRLEKDVGERPKDQPHAKLVESRSTLHKREKE